MQNKYIYILLLTCIFLGAIMYELSYINENMITYEPSKKIAIITSIYGNYDNAKSQDNVYDSDSIDWYCFTDNAGIKLSKKWKIITTPYHSVINSDYLQYKNYYNNIDTDNTRNMMCAKYYKIQAHKIDFLKKYDYYVWIDGSIFLRDAFIKNINTLIKNDYNLIHFKHSVRDNIKDELSASMYVKYENQNLKYQYSQYIKDGFEDKSGLFENTIFIRKNVSKINALFDLWWVHNLKYSFQDQISYPYVLWKSGITVDKVINHNVFNNEDYSFVKYDLMKSH
jgi:hypothetical protein